MVPAWDYVSFSKSWDYSFLGDLRSLEKAAFWGYSILLVDNGGLDCVRMGKEGVILKSDALFT